MRMKVTIEVDCTPEEARRMMGLPDLTPLRKLSVLGLDRNRLSGMLPHIPYFQYGRQCNLTGT